MSLAAIRRVRPWQEVPTDGTQWIADLRTFDIPETIAACIRCAAPGLVAITLSPLGGARMIRMAEHEARRRGIRILWWSYNPWKGKR